MTTAEICRLCGGQLTQQFKLIVLRQHEVNYYKCVNCQSLQTESPFWLTEAYGRNLSALDTGAAQRALRNLSVSFAVCKLFGVKNALDIGGGDGLLCRFLRDYGINCFVDDKYAEPTYAQGFIKPNFSVPDLVIAFEVVEHFQCPKEDFDELFAKQSDLLLISTSLFTDEGKDWWYLVPDGGQHIFFYSSYSMELLANRYGFEVVISRDFILFARKGRLGLVRKIALRLFLNKYLSRLVRSFIVLLPTPAVWTDHASQGGEIASGKFSRKNTHQADKP